MKNSSADKIVGSNDGLERCPLCGCGAKPLTEHDKGIVRDLEAMSRDKSNGFWPQALASGALRIIRERSNTI